MTQVTQFRGWAYRSVEKRLWWFPFIKVERFKCVGVAKASDPQMFPAHKETKMTYDAEEFISKLVAWQDLSQLEVEIIEECSHYMKRVWHSHNEAHALERLRLVAKEVPRNIQLKTPEKEQEPCQPISN